MGLVLFALLAGCSSPPQGVAAAVDSVYAHAEGLQPDAVEARQARDIAVIEWADELDPGEPFSYSDIERAHAQQMAAPESVDAAGTVSYGARGTTLWDSYSEELEHREQLVKSSIRDTLTKDEVRGYYEQHLDQFSRQDPITVRVTEWQDGRAVSADEVEIDETNVRMLQEGDDAVISAALALAEGARTTIERRNGTFAQLECLSRADGGFKSFDAVVQAAASQLANQHFQVELQRRQGGVS